MELIRASEKRAASYVAETLRVGGVAAVPTDTVYGLVCDVRNEAAVRRIFEMKGREERKPLSIFVRDIQMAERYAEISPEARCVLEKVWPGKVTAVFRIKNEESRIGDGKVSRRVVRDGTIAVRVSGHDFLKDLFRQIDFPVAQTSANVSGRPPAGNADAVQAYFAETEDGPDLIVDGGACDSFPSTLLDFSVFPPRILREGAVSVDVLRPVLRVCGFDRMEA